jgi:hypothetical protein
MSSRIDFSRSTGLDAPGGLKQRGHDVANTPTYKRPGADVSSRAKNAPHSLMASDIFEDPRRDPKLWAHWHMGERRGSVMGAV